MDNPPKSGCFGFIAAKIIWTRLREFGIAAGRKLLQATIQPWAGQIMRLRALVLVIPLALLTDMRSGAEEKSSSWWSRLWSRGNTPPAAKKDAAPTVAPKAPAILPAREKEVWLRRAEVCQRLREIALTSNDEALLRKADQLDQRAWETYMERIAGVRGDETVSAQRKPRKVEDEP